MTNMTALHEEHLKLGALMVDFATWDMPLHYGSQLQEHLNVRQNAGVFDVSHMLSVDIEGPDAKSFLRKLLANDINKLQAGKALYSCMLNEKGGVIDDLIAYHLNEKYFRLVVNASRREVDLAWLNQHKKGFDVTISARGDLSMLAIQGPKAWPIMRQIFTDNQNKATMDLSPFSSAMVNEWLIARTGYTGEDGLEIMLPHQDAKILWDQLLQNEVKPTGLGARDTLRLEAGLNLFGLDMDESVTPFESNLGWTVDMKDEKRDFIGKSALVTQEQQGIPFTLVGLVLLEKGVCRTGMKVWQEEDGVSKEVGSLTSGTYSPTLSCAIALARVKTAQYQALFVQIRDKKVKAKIVKPPFVKKGKANFSL